MEPKRTLILGGVSSGKSAYAEGLAEQAGPNRRYVATATVGDDEMRQKVVQHRARRGQGWSTIEAPLNLEPAFADLVSVDVILLDCLSMWLTNHLLNASDLDRERKKLIAAISSTTTPIILVSNEVGLGGVEVNSLARRFARAQGTLNQEIACLVDNVVLVTAGLPIVLKGQV